MKIIINSFFSLFLLLTNNLSAQDFWELVQQFDNSMRITGIAVDSNGSVYVSGNSSYTNTRGVFRSDDDGLTWQQKNNDICRAIAIDNEDNIFTITNMACYKSSDHGETWQMVFAPNPFVPSNNIECGFDSIVVAGGSYMNGILRSGDYGETWTVALSLDHNDVYIELISDFCFGSNGVIYASTIIQLAPGTPGNVYASYDYGNTWQVFLSEGYPESVGFDNLGRLLVGQAGDGVYRYDFSTASWEHPLANYSTTSDILVLPNDNIFLAMDIFPNWTLGGVMLSMDGGETYNYINSGFPNYEKKMDNLAKDGVGRILVSDGLSLYRSVDTIYDKIEKPILKNNIFICKPNPFHNYFEVSFADKTNQEMNFEISIFDVEGQLLYCKNVIGSNILKVEVKSLCAGFYYVLLKCRNKLYMQKLIHY